ncbi:hypothetical protein AYI70_g3139 [Smittium culicis]|uniref:Uncharacterized protein n=1 Tax=Smittium culicis TaxID=133412 RepID=A0A1R1Y565_9FUNG|nr:hypothetical protein AYI70_g3139 [Smittium culicis]
MQELLQISNNILADLNSTKLSSIPSQLSQLESLIFTPASDDQDKLQIVQFFYQNVLNNTSLDVNGMQPYSLS